MIVKEVPRWMLLLGVALVLMACGDGSNEGSADAAPGVLEEEIVIGAPADLTGPLSIVGLSGQLGVQFAVDQINENGGVHGRTLNVIFEDTESTPEGGLQAARRLIQEENPFILLGMTAGDTSVHAMPYILGEDIPWYVAFSSDPRILEEFDRNVFTGAALGEVATTQVIVDFITGEFDIESIGLAFSDNAYALAARPTVVEAFEAQDVVVAANETFASDDTDFTAVVSAFTRAAPDAVLVYGPPASSARLLVQGRDAGLDIPWFGDTANADPTLIELAGDAAEGYTTFWYASNQISSDRSGTMGAWWDDFEARFPNPPAGAGDPPAQWVLQGYTETFVVAEALRRAGPDPTREEFVAALESLDGFVAGEPDELGEEHWPFAHAIGLPRTFSAEHREGASSITPVVVENGQFRTY